MEYVLPFIWILLPLIFLLVFGLIGLLLQHLHFGSIRRREEEVRSVVTLNYDPDIQDVTHSEMVRGSAVVSADYARSFLVWLKGIFGGRIGSLMPVLDRGRREAMLRMKEAAAAAGHDTVINVRLETTRIASARADGKGTAGMELVAYGTALTRARSAP